MNPYELSHPETTTYTEPDRLAALQDATEEIREAILWLEELQSPSTDWGDLNVKTIHQEIDGHLESTQKALHWLSGDRRTDEIILTLRFLRSRLWPYRKPLSETALEGAIVALNDVLERSVFTENLH